MNDLYSIDSYQKMEGSILEYYFPDYEVRVEQPISAGTYSTAKVGSGSVTVRTDFLSC